MMRKFLAVAKRCHVQFILKISSIMTTITAEITPHKPQVILDVSHTQHHTTQQSHCMTVLNISVCACVCVCVCVYVCVYMFVYMCMYSMLSVM